MAWVSVEDQLPPQIEVLFYVKELDQVEVGTYNKCTKKWMIPYRDTYFCTGNNWIKHWGVLPDAPEET